MRKSRFLHFGDRQTDRQTDKQMDSSDALSRSRCRERRLNKHVSSVCKSAYYSIKTLRHIRPVLTCDKARAVAASLIQTRLDFANSLLIRTSGSNINKLQRVQTALLEWYFKITTNQLPPSYQNSTGFQPIRELVSKLLHSHTSHLILVSPPI